MQTTKNNPGRFQNAGIGIRAQALGPELSHIVEDRAQLFFDDYTEYDVSDVTKSVLSFSFLDRINVDIFSKYLPYVDRSGGLTDKLGLRHRRLNVPGVVGSTSSLASSNSLAGSSAVSIASTPRSSPRHTIPSHQELSAIQTDTLVESIDDEGKQVSTPPDGPSPGSLLNDADVLGTSSNASQDQNAQAVSAHTWKTKTTSHSMPTAVKQQHAISKLVASTTGSVRRALCDHHRQRFRDLNMDRSQDVTYRRRQHSKPMHNASSSKIPSRQVENLQQEQKRSDVLIPSSPVSRYSPLRCDFEEVQIAKNRSVVQAPGPSAASGHMPTLMVTLKDRELFQGDHSAAGLVNEQSAHSDCHVYSCKQVPVFSQANRTCPICHTSEMKDAIILRCGHRFCRSHLEAIQSRIRSNLCEEMASPVRWNVVCALCGDSFCYQMDALSGDQEAEHVKVSQFLPVHSREVGTYLGPLKSDWQC